MFNKRNIHERDAAVTENMSRRHGGSYASVTSITASVCPFDREVSALTASRNPNGPYFGKSVLDIIAMWEAGAAAGTTKHAVIEKFFADLDPVEKSTPAEEEATPEEPIAETEDKDKLIRERFAAFWEPHAMTWKPYRTEWKVLSKYGVVGVIDAVFKDDEDNYLIVDWKFAKAIYFRGFEGKMAEVPLADFPHCNYTEYSLQLCLYRKILEEYGIFTDRMWIVAVPPEGGVKTHWPSKALRAAVDDLWERIKTEGVDAVFPHLEKPASV